MNSLFDDSMEEHNVTPLNLENGEPKPTRPSTTNLRQQVQQQKAFDRDDGNRKNVTINSDLNETYQITPNGTPNETQYITADDVSVDSTDAYELPIAKPARTKQALVYSVAIDDQPEDFLRDLQNQKGQLRSPAPFNAVEHSVGEQNFAKHKFTTHVETKESGDVERTTPDYIDGQLVEQKDKMRDINQIPKITVATPSPELPQLKTVPQNIQNDSFTFPPPPTEAEKAKMGLKPVPETEDQESSSEPEVPTRTPSRLTFNEKLTKFRTISMDQEKQPKISKSNPDLLEEIGSELIQAGLVTSTPSVQRSQSRETKIPVFKKTVKNKDT